MAEVGDPIETIDKVRIRKLYFLIHPGFITYPGTDMASEEDLEEAEILLEKYVEKARSLMEDEVMFIFLSRNPQEYQEDIINEEIYTFYIKQLEAILGSRAIVLPEEHDIFDTPEGFNFATGIADNRGYYFDENTLTQAMGEAGGVCVIDGAQNLNEVGGFIEPTLIDPDLTDDTYGGPQAIVASNRERFSKVVFLR